MSDYITLLGAEDVARAGRNMEEAASSMNRAAGYLDETLNRHRIFMDDWLQRYEQVIKGAQND